MGSSSVSARLFYRLPKSLREAPFEAATAVLLLLAGIPQAIGKVPPPGSVARLLPHYVQIAWGLALCLGAVLVMVGLGMAARASVLALVLKGRDVERIGLILLGYAMGVYAVAIAIVGGWKGATAAALTIAFALACGIRALVLQGSSAILGEAERHVVRGEPGGEHA